VLAAVKYSHGRLLPAKEYTRVARAQMKIVIRGHWREI
jgi:hypothetical protein